MKAEEVERILDLTRPHWREEFAADKFETFEDLTKAMGEAVDEGCEKLGIRTERIH